ncbi:unnamed protein product [Arabis nemorensis]|uniref:Uncharacterized protein n=1 Tax=Arabis nemorensis TaxID=586526 RepID=A0A565B428_9BRAS|nr:unnamed protein product [Arabis nemorensis]
MMISFLFVAITTLSSVLGEDNDVVFDEDGSPIKANVPYYISFMTMDYGMWICRMRFGSNDPKSCPQQPVMFTYPPIPPTPVVFLLPSTVSDNIVRESAKLSIKFVNPLQCGESGIWRVVQRSPPIDGEVVLNGTKLSNDSTFTIHTTNEYYMFRFGEGDRLTTISLSNDRGIQRLLSKRYSGEMEILFYPAKR